MAPLAGLDYRRCRVAELKVFVKDRAGKEPPKSSKKQRLIDTLEKLDEEGVFDLLRLPAELRNNVYRQLLLLQPIAPSSSSPTSALWCQPAILRASKQIHLEAEPILYGDNVPPISLKAHIAPAGATNFRACLETHVLDVFKMRTIYHVDPVVTQLRSTCPSHLLRFRSIRIKIEIDARNDKAPSKLDELRQSLHHELCRLTSFFAPSTALKNITITLSTENDADCTSEQLQRVLSPLLRLERPNQLKISGASAAVGQYIKDGMRVGIRETEDVIGKCLRLYKKATDYQQLSDELQWIGGGRDRLFMRLLEMTDRLSLGGYVDEAEFERLRTCASNLDTCLQSGSIAELLSRSRMKRRLLKRLESTEVEV